jgi:hypothetical protein
MATEERKDNSNKLRDGPCAEHYFELEKCAAEKNITNSHMVSLMHERTFGEHFVLLVLSRMFLNTE